MRRLVRATAFRIALVFALALTLTTYAVFAVVYYEFYRANVALAETALTREVRESLDAPLDRLKERLGRRLTRDVRHLDYVGLFDADGRSLLGNVSPMRDIARDGRAHRVRLPLPSETPDGPQTLEAPQYKEDQNAIVVAAIRPDGVTIVLGRSLAVVDDLAAAMLKAFAVAIVPVGLLALAVGAFVSVRASRRLTFIQAAIRRVMDGELDVRLPARGTPDDVDALVRAVNVMLDEIVRLLAQLKSVGDNIAHDLRAPLAVMRARLERGLAGDDAAELRRLAEAALGDLERATTTATALLRISELESGLRRGAFGSVDLSCVARDVFELYAPFAESKGIAISLEAAAPVRIPGDADLMREALANLVDNAVKFTPRGGAVRIASGGEGALLGVADTGPGVDPAERDKIARRLYRGAAARDVPGHGLGLSMAATIVELHGLAIRIRDNTPGAIFEIVAAPRKPVESPPQRD